MSKWAIVLLLVTLNSKASEASSKDSLFTSQDIFELEIVTDPRVSPDGEWVVYTRRSNDIMTDNARSNLWLASIDGEYHRPLMSGKKNFAYPKWSPSGDRLLYMSNLEGKPQLYIRWMDTGQTALISNLQHRAYNLAWSPDGKYIAFTMRIPDKSRPLSVKMPKKPKGAKWSSKVKYVTKARYQSDGRGILEPSYEHIFVLPAEGGSARQITQGEFNHGGALAWAADSKQIFFSANLSENWEYEPRESDIYAVTIFGEQAGDVTAITQEKGGEYSPVVSPDGKKLAYLKVDDQKLAYRNRYLMLMSIDGGKSKNLSSKVDGTVRNIQWDAKSAGLYYQLEKRGYINIRHASLKGKHKTLVKGLGGASMGRPYTFATFHASDNVLAFTKGRADRPAELHVYQRNRTKQLTALNEDILGHKTLGKVKEIVYKSDIDGEEIQGWYILPPNFEPEKKYPLILEIHGGPHLSYGPHFSAELQRFAAEGYVVFYDNHRGSTGYGERFALLLQNKYSSKYDFSDHMSGVDALIDKGFVDLERLYIAGGSAGGIASAYAIGLTDRFKAAAVAKPVINWLSKVLTADSYLAQIPFQFPGMPWDNVEHYWQRSPLSLVGNVTTPTLLITGERDRRTPISETEQYYQALKLQKVDTIMIRVPGSSHGIAAKPSRMVAKVENILAWFKRYP